MIPDVLVFLVPFLLGIVVLITDFRWPILILMIFSSFLNFSGSTYVRGHLACNHCKQVEPGCPALERSSKGNSLSLT